MREVSGCDSCQKCDRKFVSWWGGVMVMRRSKRALEGTALQGKCGSHQGGVKGIKNECQLIDRCDGHGGGVRGWRDVIVMREV